MTKSFQFPVKKILCLAIVLLLVIVTGMYLRKMGIIQENFTKHGRKRNNMPKNG